MAGPLAGAVSPHLPSGAATLRRDTFRARKGESGHQAMTVQDPASVDVPVEQSDRPAIPRQPGAPARPVRHGLNRPWITVLIVLVLLGQMAFVMVVAARGQSSTPDEPVYIGAAVVYRQQHSLRYNPEHPPLAKE